MNNAFLFAVAISDLVVAVQCFAYWASDRDPIGLVAGIVLIFIAFLLINKIAL